MLFRQLFDTTSSTYSYLLADGIGRDAVIIDPVREHLADYLRLITELELKLVHAIDTHTHADHITALGGLRARSEEHTSELQSLMRISYAVFCLKKKNNHDKNPNTRTTTPTNIHDNKPDN